MIKEEYWQNRPEFIQINPTGSLPVLSLNNGEIILIDLYPIIEYMAESFPDFHFMPRDIKEKSQVRKYLVWFNQNFYFEVSRILVEEKMIRLLRRAGSPRMEYINIAKRNLTQHLKYLTNLLQDNTYLLTPQISCADIAAAAHISTIDYFGEINWDSWPKLHYWYSLIKSRPGFRPILQDQISGFTPPKEYADIDF